jgi:hypothetical protein
MSQQELTLRALRHAMDQICERAGKRDECYRWKTRRGVRRIVQFVPPKEFYELHEAWEMVQDGKLEPEAAMGLVTRPDVMHQRFSA